MGSRYNTVGTARIVTDPKPVHGSRWWGVEGETDKGERVFFYAKLKEIAALGWVAGVEGVEYNGVKQFRIFSKIPWIKLYVEACK